jgi:capsular exopolysaccharide synthesis family protein
VTESPGSTSTAVELQSYAALLWRRKWWVAAVATGCAVVAAVAPDGGQARSYRSSADVLVTPIVANHLEAPARVDDAVDLDTESQVVESTAVARIGAAKLGDADAAEMLAEQVTATASSGTQVMSVSFTAPSPAAAQAGAQAFAEAYLQYRGDEARTAIQTITEGIQARKTDLIGQLHAAGAAMAANLPETTGHIQAQSARNVLTSQISLLDSQLASYAAADVDPGTIIRPAGASAPVRPRRLPVPLAGAMGLVAGAAVAFVRDRFDRRLHYAGNPRRVAGLPVITTIPRRRRSRQPDLIAGSRSADGEAYQRLATNVVAALAGGGTVVVTSPSPGEGKTTVSANLAVALARSGRRVAVVSADLRLPTLHRFFALPAGGPSVNDVLAGLSSEEGEAVAVPRWPNLTVYPSRPDTGHPGEQLQSPAMTAFLERLRARNEYVIVDAPPVLPVADVLPLAAAATATILVGRQHRTAQGALRDSAAELGQIGARLIGAVITRTGRAGRRDGYFAYTPAGRHAALRRHELAVAATAAFVLVAAAGSAAAINQGWPDRRSAEPTAAATAPPTVLGMTVTRPPDPVTTTTVTTVRPAPPAPPTTTSTTRPPATTSTTVKATTTTTLPPSITPASATAAGAGVSLTLEATPVRRRSVTMRLTTGLSEGRVLRAVRIDYGDGKVVEPGIEEWACWAPGAPNPYVLTAPTRSYGATGTYSVTVTVTTATCSPDDDDWGPEENAEIRLTLSVP